MSRSRFELLLDLLIPVVSLVVGAGRVVAVGSAGILARRAKERD